MKINENMALLMEKKKVIHFRIRKPLRRIVKIHWYGEKPMKYNF
jgi:hypothetical protein